MSLKGPESVIAYSQASGSWLNSGVMLPLLAHVIICAAVHGAVSDYTGLYVSNIVFKSLMLSQIE